MWLFRLSDMQDVQLLESQELRESVGKMEKFESEDPELQPFVPPSLHLHKDGEQMSPKAFPPKLWCI